MWRGWCDEERTPSSSPAPLHGDRGAAQPVAPLESLKPVQSLDAGIIPQRLFPIRRWFYANQLWYYHAPATTHRLRTDPKFFELVDPLLRDLCAKILAAGLCTTPSCQGHFYPVARFERIWKELVAEAEGIRGGGLRVSDSETNEAFRFRDPAYVLPWQEYDAFLAQAFDHQSNGYLGVAIPDSRNDLIERFSRTPFESGTGKMLRDDELSRAIGQTIFSITVKPRTPEERDAVWRCISVYFDAML